MNAKPRTARRAGLTMTLIGAALVTSACANGKEAQTANEKPTLDGNNANVGNMLLRGMVIATPPTGKYSTGEDAALKLVIVNKERRHRHPHRDHQPGLRELEHLRIQRRGQRLHRGPAAGCGRLLRVDVPLDQPGDVRAPRFRWASRRSR